MDAGGRRNPGQLLVRAKSVNPFSFIASIRGQSRLRCFCHSRESGNPLFRHSELVEESDDFSNATPEPAHRQAEARRCNSLYSSFFYSLVISSYAFLIKWNCRFDKVTCTILIKVFIIFAYVEWTCFVRF